MRTVWRDDHTIRLGLLGISLTLIYLTVLVPLGFLEEIRAASTDTSLRWRNRILQPPKEISDLVLINIDDESQRHLNQKWPWDRAIFADFLHRVATYSPKGVLLDFAFVGESLPGSDTALTQALEQGPPTFIAAYLDPKGELMLPQSRFIQAGGITGLINKPLDGDHVIRRAWGAIHFLGQSEPLFGIEVRAAALLSGLSQNQIRWEKSSLIFGAKPVSVGRVGEFPINYLSSSFPTISFWEVMQGSVDSSRIQDKLVIVGPTREITHDIHSTPIGRLPGIVIEANTVLTLLTGRFLKDYPLWVMLPLAFLFTIGIEQISYRFSLPIGILVTSILIGSVIGLGFLLSCRDIHVEFVSPIVLGGVAWITGFIYKYLVIAAATLRLQRLAVTDSLTGALTHHYFRLRVQEELRQFHLVKQPASLILMQVSTPSQMLHHQPWDKVKHLLSSLVQMFKQSLPPRGFVGYLQEGYFGLFLPNTGLSQAQGTLKKLQGSLTPGSGITGLGLASTEQNLIQTGDGLFRCAEIALRQAVLKGTRAEIYSPTPGEGTQEQITSGANNERGGTTELDVVSSELEERNRALEKALTELREIHQQLESSFLEVTKTLVLALETKDTYTAGHLERVSRYSTRLAEVLNLPKEEVAAIREAALLHDIGKIGLPDEVLHKVGKLTDAEREIIKEHLSIGAKILEPMKFFKSITTLIFHHHEWYNGQGYPHGLAGELIPPGAQIIAIADSFDAMTTQRSYNKPRTPQEALEEIKRGGGTQFNPLYVDKFVEVITQEGPQLAGYAAA